MEPALHKLSFPNAADDAAAQRLTEAFRTLGRAEAAFAATSDGRALLACLGGNAPYLAGLACRESMTLRQVISQGPDKIIGKILAKLATLRPQTSTGQTRAALRQAKRQAALAIAIADLAGLWPLEMITGTLSRLAEAAVQAAFRHLLREMHEARSIKLPHKTTPERDCGVVALALGKLGASELNYSSDIDLVLIFDQDAPHFGPETPKLMARFARGLVALLAERDEDGYVFRVDLRLRPDPGATPAVVSLAAALQYYETQGRTWERAAFSKARPIGGDLALGAQFLTAIRPFIWRKNLDFAAIDDIHGMKRRIDAKQGNDALPGHNVKLGRGGIREIEFIVQTLSLVWGGQNPALRLPQTLLALPALAKAGHLPAKDARELAADYLTLRRIEHRLQMVDDAQTHCLPTSDAGLRAFAIFLGEPDFRMIFPKLLARVHARYQAFFDAGEDEAAQPFDPGSTEAVPATFAARVHALGFKDDKHIAERLRAWANGDVPALRAERARALLAGILPILLNELGAQPMPDKAFALFDTLLSRQRAGVGLLSLFQRNPALLKRLAAILGAAPALAEHLAGDAYALETLLSPHARFAAPRPLLRRMLADAADLEEAIAIIRRFVRREEFHLSVATFEGRLDIDEAGKLRSDLAAVALHELLPYVITAHQARNGRLRGAAFAIIALGKAGASEMLAGSDLDLMFIYDHPATDIPPSGYFVRLSHALTGALTAQGVEGPLYAVDMRLRPSGNQGPVAVSLSAFARYHAEESWTWERLALTRAKVLAATPGFKKKVDQAILTALRRKAPAAEILRDTAAMRTRLLTERPPRAPFDVKHLPGGMLALGFIAEALMLIYGQDNPGLFRQNTASAILALADAQYLDSETAQRLIAAGRLWRVIQGINRITGLSENATAPQQAMLAALLRATGYVDANALHAAMTEASDMVSGYFAHFITKGANA